MSCLQAYHLAKSADARQAGRLLDRCLKENERLAYSIAKRLAGVCKEDLEDLKQLALMGLAKAIKRFNPDLGKAFSSFAVPYIRGEILHHLRDHWDLLKIPRRWLEAMEAVDRVERRLLAKGRILPRWQIAEALGFTQSQWEQIEQAFQATTFAFPDDEELNLPDLTGADNDRNELRQELLQHLARLPDPYRTCLLQSYFEQQSDKAIARQLNATPSQVRDWLAQGLELMRNGHFEQMKVAA
jgi:RNA polymerase sigma-B factor